jgi:hypothetical protein
MKKPVARKKAEKIMTAIEWEAEAVDFMPAELDKMLAADVLQYAQEAQDFILRTMLQMELRPSRSFIRRLKKGKK